MKTFLVWWSAMSALIIALAIAYSIPSYERRGTPCFVGKQFGFIMSEDKHNWFNPRPTITVLYINNLGTWEEREFPHQLVIVP